MTVLSDRCVQVEVKKAEPRDVKLVVDCLTSSKSSAIETTDGTDAAAATAADYDDAVLSASVAGGI